MRAVGNIFVLHPHGIVDRISIPNGVWRGVRLGSIQSFDVRATQARYLTLPVATCEVSILLHAEVLEQIAETTAPR